MFTPWLYIVSSWWWRTLNPTCAMCAGGRSRWSIVLCLLFLLLFTQPNHFVVRYSQPNAGCKLTKITNSFTCCFLISRQKILCPLTRLRYILCVLWVHLNYDCLYSKTWIYRRFEKCTLIVGMIHPIDLIL
jgi:hypothetical protein